MRVSLMQNNNATRSGFGLPVAGDRCRDEKLRHCGKLWSRETVNHPSFLWAGKKDMRQGVKNVCAEICLRHGREAVRDAKENMTNCCLNFSIFRNKRRSLKFVNWVSGSAAKVGRTSFAFNRGTQFSSSFPFPELENSVILFWMTLTLCQCSFRLPLRQPQGWHFLFYPRILRALKLHNYR